MKNKYYTPELEEFRVGFEYEYNNTWGGFSKRIVTEENLMDKLINIGSGNDRVPFNYNWRVKYLDKQDIESLGFGNYKRAVCHWYKMEGHFKDGFGAYGKWSKIRLLHCKDLNTIKIKAFEHSWDEEETVLFQGKIKNKSELKKLLKQLNIE